MDGIAGVGLYLAVIGRMVIDMKSKLLLLFLLLITPCIAIGGSQQIRNVVTMAKSSSTDWLVQTAGDTEGSNTHSVRSFGQGIYPVAPQTLNAVTVKTGANGYGYPISAKMRVGTTTDLSTSYLAESVSTSLTNTETEIEFTFTTGVSLSANTQYYFAVSVLDDLDTHYFNLLVASGNPYSASGSSNAYGGSTGKYILDNQWTGYDLYLKIR